ncbi:SDR family NAD(P)-dependent oxidoreductase [Roseovarius dicentrarchi]|uniref:SDR family NAD(P)-dependent oxidoreductase n=1 Tax=Roseovarius dicentrarchi TaxID=2250573 RepID=UPI000DE9B4C8|nr:SDR family oxidoreductase [Roseovarius dicentrarchi]
MITANLTGKTALIAGGASGIGFAAARMLGQSGATVCINHLAGDPVAPDRIAQLRSTGIDAHAAEGDVSDPGSARIMVTNAIQTLGGLDILINNAGTSGGAQPIAFGELDKMTEEFWQQILSTNLLGVFRCTSAAADALRASRGAVVNTASISGFGVRGSSIAYAASKAALINLTRSLSVALAPDVRVNAVAPGFVDTPWTQGWSDERRAKAVARTLLKRMAAPEDIAEAMLYLAAGAAYVTGQTIILDGGTAP